MLNKKNKKKLLFVHGCNNKACNGLIVGHAQITGVYLVRTNHPLPRGQEPCTPNLAFLLAVVCITLCFIQLTVLFGRGFLYCCKISASFLIAVNDVLPTKIIRIKVLCLYR